MKLWQKDQSVNTSEWVERYTAGRDVELDQRLVPYDVLATLAHARGLLHIGLLREDEWQALRTALRELLQAYDRGEFQVTVEQEDVHTAIEQYLTRHLGEIGKKVHTGRSRNDQVLAALRLYTRESLQHLVARVIRALEALLELALTYRGVIMPGYTHMQPAMPTSAGLWALSYAESFLDDLTALESAYTLNNRSPLGSAAGYGVPYLNLPRQKVAAWLGFERPQVHVAAVQLSRGKIESTVGHAILLLGLTASRFAADLILFHMPELGFVRLPEELCTGSSIMPQKRNPDVLELTRARVHRLAGELRVLEGIPAGLPSGYHRDLQLTKEALLRVLDEGNDICEAVGRVAAGVTFHAERCYDACPPELFATAEALRLVVEEGVPFREAYRRVGKAPDQVRKPSPEEILEHYVHYGSLGDLHPSWVVEELQRWKDWLRWEQEKEARIRKQLLEED